MVQRAHTGRKGLYSMADIGQRTADKRGEITYSFMAKLYSNPGVTASIIAFVVGLLIFGFGHWPLVLAIAAALIAASILIVPPAHYAVHELLGARSGRISLEGLRFIIPFLETAHFISRELHGIPFKAVFTTEDNMELVVTGELQYRADPQLTNKEGKNLFFELSDIIIQRGISEAIESKLGALGGIYKLKDFITHRHAIADFLNAYFRLETMPHLDHEPNSDNKCGRRTACQFPEQVSAQDLFEFYDTHRQLVKTILDTEKGRTAEFSVIERRYGIDVEFVPFGQISFSGETTRSLEREQQAAARARAFEFKMGMIKKARAEDASFQEAANAADIALEPDVAKNKKIISVEGIEALVRAAKAVKEGGSG